MEEQKVGFKDLSGWVKVGVVGGCVYMAIASIYFLVGLFETIIGG